MKILSCYQKCLPNEHFKYWEDINGIEIPKEIARQLNSDCLAYFQIGNAHYDCPIGFDIAYCQMYNMPKQRPANILYSFVSDYYDTEIELWVSIVKPDVIFALNGLQRFEERRARLEKLGGELVFAPWCSNYIGGVEKTNDIFISGCINGNYPFRNTACKYLDENVKSPLKYISSCSTEFGKYKLTIEEYGKVLQKSRIYIAGLIFDELLPPKLFEAASNDCCIITHSKNDKWLKEAGFINGEHYLNIDNPEQILEFASEEWKDRTLAIGRNAGKLIREKHTINKRATQIVRKLECLLQKKS